jgi:hypothetical protein
MARSRWTREAHREHKKRWVTAGSVSLLDDNSWGFWLCHEPTMTWFECFDSVEDRGSTMVVGFKINKEPIVVPTKECYHAWDPAIDAR